MIDLPSYETVFVLLSMRDVGARLCQGPWQLLPGGKIGVPAVAYMSLAPMGEIVLKRGDTVWKQGRASWKIDREEHKVTSEIEAIFGGKGSI